MFAIFWWKTIFQKSAIISFYHFAINSIHSILTRWSTSIFEIEKFHINFCDISVVFLSKFCYCFHNLEFLISSTQQKLLKEYIFPSFARNWYILYSRPQIDYHFHLAFIRPLIYFLITSAFRFLFLSRNYFPKTDQ